MIHVLFVCLGNICRSPMAEAVFNALLKKEGLQEQIQCDSAGTSNYHIGELPDSRTMDIINEYNLSLQHLGRQFLADDFEKFDYIIAMDQSNRDNILKLEKKGREKGYKVFLMREFEDDAVDMDVPDPYWSAQDGFTEVYNILWRSSQNLLDYIRKEHQL
ncbi:low molecular weight protein-tyrosine-phosphatase [Catalinimonas niigatensis]|uniref:low molecular weight protein-tyrosine-phosphatase n=1 Tax=Catalinimonas niigatensis TaxID=1397264 RepID=UPI002665A9B5|nr:low molecular weight protein-tyrosine-phosphatase [Catalinimonas niigatensis]WPP52853.1 low molecular weight protein-tyrosine-phosphatase [Catalinimonas niigatensis]